MQPMGMSPQYGHPGMMAQPQMMGQSPMMGQPAMMPPQMYGQPMGGADQGEIQQLKAQLNQMQKEQAALKEVTGYQDMAKKLMSVDGLYIRQKFNMMEAATGCNMPDKYHVFQLENTENAQYSKPMFRFTESSGCCSRTCLKADCRPLKMEVTNLQYGTEQDCPVLYIERPCKCTCLCCNRQEFQVQWTEKGQQKFIGKITDPWDCCNYSFKILDETDACVYVIEASSCQIGFCCSTFPCDACQKVEFTIKEPGKDFVVGKLEKVGRGCCINALDFSYNCFKVQFPKTQNWKHRVIYYLQRL